MGKIFVEDVEIVTNEKNELVNEEHIFEKTSYIHRSFMKIEFKSSIFKYGEDEKILISRTTRFGKSYYKIVLFSDKLQKAWNLIELSAELDVKIKRLTNNNFIVVGNNQGGGNVSSQASFCKLKPSTKTEEITIIFTKLADIQFLGNNKVLLCYETYDAADSRTEQTLALYNNEGVLQQTLYEFFDDDKVTYSYQVVGNEIKVLKKTK